MIIKILIEYNQIKFNKAASWYNHSRYDITKRSSFKLLHTDVSHVIQKFNDIDNYADYEIHLSSGAIIYGEGELIEDNYIGCGGKFVEIVVI